MYALDLSYSRVGRLGLLCLMPLAATIMLFAPSRPAAADTNPCTDVLIRSASVQSTLQVKISGVDQPSITSITKVSIPESWRGTMALYGNGQQQGNSLNCFMPIKQKDYQSAPPDIVIDPPSRSAPASTDITNSITMWDGPEAGQSWAEGLWSVRKHPWGYQVTFDPEGIPAASNHGRWTVTLDAPGLNIQGLTREPSTDDGHGDLTWSFPASHKQLPGITLSLTSPWQVRLNLATDRWPVRWVADVSSVLGGALADMAALWLGFRLLRRRRGEPRLQILPKTLIFLSVLSISSNLGFIADDYLWHNVYNLHVVSSVENGALLAIAVAYLLTALGIRLRWVIGLACVLFVVASLALIPLRAHFFAFYDTEPASAAAVANLIVLIAPLLVTLTLMWAGTVLWIARLWPFGARARQGQLRDMSDTPFGGTRIIALLSCAFVLSALILGQSAGASYYYWLHSELWGQGNGAFPRVAGDLLSDTHWWIGDGLQWPLFFAVSAGVLAALWSMSADARGVFFGPYRASGPDQTSDRRDLVLMAVILASFALAGAGLYEGIWVPLSFIVGFIALVGFSLTRSLSRLDWEQRAQLPAAGSNVGADSSFLVAYRNELLSGQSGTKLPKTVDPELTALALGPADTWWDNGVAALKHGAYLAIIPIAYENYVYWTLGGLSQFNFPFGLQDALGNIVGDILGWLAAIFMFGVLLPYLRGFRTPIKGFIFGLISFVTQASDAAVRHALGITPARYFPVDGLLMVTFFMALGVLLDVKTLRNHQVDKGQTDKLSPFTSARVLVTSVTTLIVVGVTIWQTIYLTDQTAQQRAQNIANTAQYVNNVGGVMPPAPGGPG